MITPAKKKTANFLDDYNINNIKYDRFYSKLESHNYSYNWSLISETFETCRLKFYEFMSKIPCNPIIIGIEFQGIVFEISTKDGKKIFKIEGMRPSYILSIYGQKKHNGENYFIEIAKEKTFANVITHLTKYGCEKTDESINLKCENTFTIVDLLMDILREKKTVKKDDYRETYLTLLDKYNKLVVATDGYIDKFEELKILKKQTARPENYIKLRIDEAREEINKEFNDKLKAVKEKLESCNEKLESCNEKLEICNEKYNKYKRKYLKKCGKLV